MKFNKLARELNLSVSELANQVSEILPNANGGTDVSDAQKDAILKHLTQPAPDTHTPLSLLEGHGNDPILSILSERIERETQLETPEQLVDQMITRYLQNPDDLPADPDYREAIITYVSLVKKRHTHRQQQSFKLRSLLRQQASEHFTAEPSLLESFYVSEPNSNTANAPLTGNAPRPKLSAAKS